MKPFDPEAASSNNPQTSLVLTCAHLCVRLYNTVHAQLIEKNTKKDFHVASVQVKRFPRLEKTQEDESLESAPAAITASKSNIKVQSFSHLTFNTVT